MVVVSRGMAVRPVGELMTGVAWVTAGLNSPTADSDIAAIRIE